MKYPSFMDVSYSRGELDEPVQDEWLLKCPTCLPPLTNLCIEVTSLCVCMCVCVCVGGGGASREGSPIVFWTRQKLEPQASEGTRWKITSQYSVMMQKKSLSIKLSWNFTMEGWSSYKERRPVPVQVYCGVPLAFTLLWKPYTHSL